MPKFKPVYRLLIDEYVGFMVSALDLLSEIGMVLTPLMSKQAPLLFCYKHITLLDAASSFQILQAVWQSIEMTHQQLVLWYHPNR